jgi:type VI secretion system secreted protein VgrG
MDASPAQASLNNNLEQMKGLSEAAKNQHANPLTSIDQLKSCIDALEAKVEGFKQALLILSSPNDIALTTPSNIHSHAGQHQTQSATGSIHQAAGKDYSLVTGKGISLFTADQGTKIFTAKGKVEIQAQSDNLEAIAAKTIKIISTQDGVEITASKSITLTAGGSQIKIGQNGIEIISPSPIQYKGAQHVFKGGASVSASLPELPQLGPQAVQFMFTSLGGQAISNAQVWIIDQNDKRILFEGLTANSGISSPSIQEDIKRYNTLIGFNTWSSFFEDDIKVEADDDTFDLGEHGSQTDI